MKWLLLFVAVSAEAKSPIRAGFVEAVDKIVQRSPLVLRQSETLEATRSRNLPQGTLLFFPSFSAEGKVGSQREFGTTTAAKSVEGVAELNLFRFGADWATTKAASREIETQEHLLLNTILSAEGEAVGALVDFIQAKHLYEVALRLLASRKDSLDIAKKRYNKGQLPSEEVDKVSVDLDNAGAQAKDAESSLAQARAELERLLGEPEIAAEWPWKDQLARAAAPLLKRTNSDLIQRPDWRAANQAAEAAEQRSKAAFGAFLPRLDARASYGYFSSETLGVKTTGPGWTAGLSLTVPLFDRLVGYSQYQTQVHAHAVAEADFEGVKRAAKKDFDSAKATFSISLETALAREKTLGTARKLYQANLERFNRGILSANDFRIDQDRMFETESNQLKGWAAAHNDFRRLCHAVGKRVEGCLNEK